MKTLFHIRIVVCLLVAMLILQAAPLQAFAEASHEYGFWGNIEYEMNFATGELIISGDGPIPYIGPHASDMLKLPWYHYRDQVKILRVEDGVTEIPFRTLDLCNNITAIYVGKDVQKIDEYTLYFATVFDGFEVSSENQYYCSENGVLYNKDKSILYRVPQTMEGSFRTPTTVTEIAIGAAMGCKLLTDVTFHNGITVIGKDAFHGCEALNSVYIPDSVIDIGTYAFAGCKNAKELYISKNVRTIRPYAFQEMTSLKHVVLPKDLYEIKAGGFKDCTSLETVVMYNDLREIHLGFDGCENLKDIYYIGTNEELWKFNERPDYLFYPYNLRFGIDGTLPNGMKWDLESNRKIMTITGTGSLNGSEDIWEEYGDYFDAVYVSEGVSGIEKCIDSSFKAYGTEKVNGKTYKVYSKSYTITFDANGGTNAPAPQTKRPGQDFTLTDEKPKREGYAFLGWAEHRLEETPAYYSGGDFDKSRDITLYAVWGEVYATDLKLAAPPSKKVYQIGEALDLTGIMVELYSNDGSVYLLPAEYYSVSGYDPEKTGKQTVTVDYYGMQVTFQVTVVENAVVTEVTAKIGKTEYTVGETFDQSSLELTVTYSDGSTKQVTDGFSVEGFDSSKAGICGITVSYEGVTASFEVTIVEKETEPQSTGEQTVPPETDPTDGVTDKENGFDVSEPGGENIPVQDQPHEDFMPLIYIGMAITALMIAAIVIVMIKKKKRY